MITTCRVISSRSFRDRKMPRAAQRRLVEEIEATGLLRCGWSAARQNQANYLPRNVRRNEVPVNLFLAND